MSSYFVYECSELDLLKSRLKKYLLAEVKVWSMDCNVGLWEPLSDCGMESRSSQVALSVSILGLDPEGA